MHTIERGMPCFLDFVHLVDVCVQIPSGHNINQVNKIKEKQDLPWCTAWCVGKACDGSGQLLRAISTTAAAAAAVGTAAVQVVAVAYDNPIPGYGTTTTSNLRLWDAQPVDEFDLTAFNAGDYDKVCVCGGEGVCVCVAVLGCVPQKKRGPLLL